MLFRSSWGSLGSRVEANTGAVLDLFAAAGVQATFFTLGWVAQRHPRLIRRIVAAGHEIASHGWDHRRAFTMGAPAFRADRANMDVTALAASADGLLVAAARTDNWLDVYDARMLARGPLRRCAHEREQDPRVAPTYGVVKAQWVEGRPWGEGLISGGVDGACLVCAS